MKRKSKRKLKKGRVLVLFIVILLLIIGVTSIVKKVSLNNANDNTKKETNSNRDSKNKESSLSMIMVGDNIIHEAVYTDANKNASGSGYNFKPMYKLVKPIISKYDLAYVNQETVLGGSALGISGYPTFNSPYETGDDLIDTGFNLVSLATNHVMDSGLQAIKNSNDYWSLQKNVLTAGTYSSQEKRDNPTISEKNGITYAMLNYTYGINGTSIPSSQSYLVNIWPTNDKTAFENYKSQVKKDVDSVRDKVDVLIVAMHWGVEYTEAPTSYQKDAAEYLSSLGVNIIVGTHPHIIEPVTWINDTLVYYSLGNFLSSQYQDDNYNKVVGLMGSLKITKSKEGKIKISDVSNELVYNYYSKERTNLELIPFSNKEIANKLTDYKSVYNSYKKVVQKMDKDMYVKPCYE